MTPRPAELREEMDRICCTPRKLQIHAPGGAGRMGVSPLRGCHGRPHTHTHLRGGPVNPLRKSEGTGIVVLVARADASRDGSYDRPSCALQLDKRTILPPHSCCAQPGCMVATATDWKQRA